MRTIKEVTNDLKIQLEKKCGRNYVYRIYIHDSDKTVNKFTRKSFIDCQFSFVLSKELENDKYRTSSRTEQFLFELLDFELFGNFNADLNAEKIEIYRKYLLGKITLEQVNLYKFITVTH